MRPRFADEGGPDRGCGASGVGGHRRRTPEGPASSRTQRQVGREPSPSATPGRHSGAFGTGSSRRFMSTCYERTDNRGRGPSAIDSNPCHSANWRDRPHLVNSSPALDGGIRRRNQSPRFSSIRRQIHGSGFRYCLATRPGPRFRRAVRPAHRPAGPRAARVRRIVRHDITAERVRELNPLAVILSGGPSSVYEPGAPHCDPGIFDLGVPDAGDLLRHAAGLRGDGGSVQAASDRASSAAPNAA